MKRFLILFAASLFALCLSLQAADYLVFEGKSGPGVGRHVVFLSGDEEYRSEESLPQLAKILAERHGFKCTVLFAINPANGTIDPNIKTNMPGAEALDSADAIVMALRFREWPDAQMKHFVDAYLAGKPIIALRTSTHAFNYANDSASPYAKFSWNSKAWQGGFGRQVLGETWVAHHGAHKKEATRGIIESSAANDPILRGVSDIFGNTDVYAANPPGDVKILVRGQVLSGINPTDSAVEGKKNDPMQPVVWTRLSKNEAGKTNKILCTTMGAATDFLNEGLRRLLVNAVYWGVGLAVPAKADVALVGNYQPTMYGFDGYVKGVKPDDMVRDSKKGAARDTGNAKSGARANAMSASAKFLAMATWLLADARSDARPTSSTAKATDALDLKQGDHIAIIGNTLADRFQHSGWFETFIYSKYPNLDLVFRNLAVAGDEVAVRHRPADFGSADDWLKKVQADVIFAFFGFNESFHGSEGLAKFRSDLDRFLKDTAAKNYSGKDAPRVVLFSPIALEKHKDSDLPDPAANNANIRAYAQAMREVANANGVLFVDLFGPSAELYSEAAARGESLTINGIHLGDQGDKLLAQAMFKGVFGKELPMSIGAKESQGEGPTEKLRQAINEKNEQWEGRYRTIDGNNVYGGRSKLAYQPEKGGFIEDRTPPEPYVSNFKVMQEEMSQRDVMTANRDKRVWAIAKGGDLKVDYSNLPSVTKVKSNHPGPDADESFPFLGGEDAIKKMKVHSGMKVNLFASEEQFPELAKPVQMAWDTKGRLWVAVWPNYPERTPDSKAGDSLLMFEDTNGDGKADKCTHYIDDLNGPTGFQFYKDGVLVMEAPDLWFVRDTTGDGKADWQERILMGLSSADSHHTANSMCLDPGGAVYLSDGVFHRTQVETATGPVRNNDAAIFRFEPRTAKFETYVSFDFANPHGRVFDYWGNDIITDGTGNNSYFGPAFSGHIDYPAKHHRLKQFWDRPSRPCAATTLLTSRHFPDEFQGNFLNCNVISFQGIYRVKITEDGSGLKGESKEDLVSSSDGNFRPVAVNVGPDGAIYFADWQNPIIGHMQHHLRDPNRDHAHGRIYRITCEGRPLMKLPKIDGQPLPALLELLKEPENQIREWAKIELGKRDKAEVIAAVTKWADGLDSHAANYEHNMMEALWVHQWFNAVDVELLKRMLRSSEPHARAAAGRVLCYWRDRVPDSLSLFKTLANDVNPRVRLEAVRGASFYRIPEAIDVALEALKHPVDYYLDYTLRETMRQLEPWRQKALESNVPLAADNPAGREFLLQTIKTPELLKLPRSPMILQTLLTRADASDADRMVALGDLAKARQTNLVAVLLTEIDTALNSVGREKKSSAELSTLARLFPSQIPDVLKTFRSRLAQLTSAESADLRQNAWAASALAEGSFDAIWAAASKQSSTLADMVNGIPLLTDPDFRAKAYDKVKPLVANRQTDTQVRCAAIRALVSMNHEPEAVFSSLTALIDRGEQVPAAAQGLRVIPRPKWPRAQAGPAVKGLVAWARTVPVSDRTTQDYSQIVQLAGDLAGLLPAEQATNVRKELRELHVSLFVIRTVREQMRYDTPRLVVEAGRPFEIIFENLDFMSHNLLIVKPNTREKIGLAAAAMKPEDIDSEGRSYVPSTSDVLAATKMLQTGEKETLRLAAPSDEGECEYVCTFPGHYQVMRGQLIVTKDVESYLGAHPEPVLPTAPVSSEDGSPAAHAHAH
jgi:azurin/glucose/arabinose dehydrogenase